MNNDKILIVEDERIIAIDLKRRLEKFGFIVCGITSTRESTIESIKKHKPNIILMDIMLSGDLDGVDIAREINTLFRIPVIFLTAFSDEKTIERAKIAEPAGFILKPFKEKELYTSIDIALYKDKINQKLRVQELWRSSILNSISEGIIAADDTGSIRFMNPVAERILNMEELDARDKNIGDILRIFQEGNDQRIIFPAFYDNENSSEPFVFSDCYIQSSTVPTHVEGALSKISDIEGKIKGQVIALRDITRMREMSDQISYQASHDILTGLGNREEFARDLNRLIKEAKSKKIEHALLYLDLDQFKLINDTCGHAAGDELLMATSKIIQNLVRSSDLSARVGSDEFGIVLIKSDEEQALHIAHRLHDKLNQHKLMWDHRVYNISASMSLVMIDETSVDLNSVLAAADDALSLAKDEGGNRIKVYETRNNVFKKRRGEMEWINRIKSALEEDRFLLYYQPIVPVSDITHGSKSEILIRMLDSDGNIIQPVDFIPAAERFKLMGAIDKWIIHHALQQYKSLKDQGKLEEKNKFISINLSAQSLADESLLDFIMKEIKKINISPENFCFEVTETAAISNMATAVQLIGELRKFGCTFALDDFGSGFSSFSYLKNLPVDYLKIDGMFVKDMDVDEVNRAMVEAMNNLGHVIGKYTIAEYVRNEAILQKLKLIGVDFAQGYVISPPLPFGSI